MMHPYYQYDKTRSEHHNNLKVRPLRMIYRDSEALQQFIDTIPEIREKLLMESR